MGRRTSEQWQALLTEHTQSGLTVAAFCRQHGINQKYFYLRRKQLSVSTKSAFIPVSVVAQPRTEMQLDYREASLQLPPDVSPQWLASLMRNLSA